MSDNEWRELLARIRETIARTDELIAKSLARLEKLED